MEKGYETIGEFKEKRNKYKRLSGICGIGALLGILTFFSTFPAFYHKVNNDEKASRSVLEMVVSGITLSVCGGGFYGFANREEEYAAEINSLEGK